MIPKLDMKEIIWQRERKPEFQAEEEVSIKVGTMEGEGGQPLSASRGVTIKWDFLVRREIVFCCHSSIT